MELKDSSIRQRFIQEHRHNFSVIAPAGVGKTTAITRRIAAIVARHSIPLEKLVVVTYTKKAAEELRQRTWLEVQKIGGNASLCNKIFFGTIHAFADKLLRQHGHFIGIAPDFEIEQNEKYLWDTFLQSFETTPFKLGSIGILLTREQLYVLVEKFYASEMDAQITPRLPVLDLCSLLKYKAKNNTNILKFQNDLRFWVENPELSFPQIPTKAKEFVLLYENAIASLEDWCSAACIPYFKRIAEAYEKFRIQQKRLTFSDLIKLSVDLLDGQISGPLLRQYYVILDEAQDTDTRQFRLLLGVAQHVEAKDSDFFKSPPAIGRYCMVGDPQQSIYSDRANVAFYQKIHQTLTHVGAMEELIFPVTLRFGPHIVQNINHTFSSILDGRDHQVSFAKISSGLDLPAYQSNIASWSCATVTEEVDELTFLAHFFGDRNPTHFGVNRWSEIAILCPRKAWLFEIQDCFSKQSLVPKTQMHSATKTYGEYREFSWIRALVILMINPENQFEFTGVLREMFGIADTLIAKYFHGQEVPEIFILKEKFQQWHKKCQSLSPIQVIDFLVKTLDIRMRLQVLQNNFNDKIEKTLHFGAVQCKSLLQFAEYLKHQSSEVFQSDSIDKDALQLYTFHKSKGLEWPVIILPFINRKQTPAPHILPEIIDGKITISDRQYQQWSDSNASTNNGERLLYVALTRQKQQTIFIDDGTEPKIYSIAETLQSTIHNKDLIINLPLFQFFKTQTIFDQHSSSFPVNSPIIINYKLSPKQTYFPLLTPSQTSKILGEKVRYGVPLVYGNWWHETMKGCSFRDEGRTAFLLSAIKNAPDINQAEHDIEKFIQNSIFWQWIQECEQIFYEYPFFIRNCDYILEGRIDLLLKTQNRLRIIDWKTEHIEDLKYFIEKHAHQMQNYKVALQQLFPDFHIDANIYSTELGKLISTT
ncbi:MAG: UvrD-helicase domain-containing protein [Puniceicoccales bacterium]|jgi:ATP-dependent exoDNAse (exonuclease V) beta subunit|nr:UvrD-helicase domain-containing protein [Puniceicoccales bacterium]